MKYYRFRIKTTVEAEDVIISAMQEIGLEGAQIEDHVPLSAAEKEQQYIYEGAEPDEVIPDDGIAYLSFYVEDDVPRVTDDINSTLDALRPHVNIGAGTVTVDVMDDADWKDNWKQFFHKFYIDDILILPSWEDVEDGDTGDGFPVQCINAQRTVPCVAAPPAHILRIDPGTAFGTGAHETTQLCIRALRKHIKTGDRILDVGTGSGVLSILALMFGASHAVGTDLDPQVITAVADNLERNNIAEESFKLVMGNLIDDAATQEAVGTDYDIVLANILPTVLVPLTPVIPRFLKDGGLYITSGILTERVPEVRGAMEAAGLVIIDINKQNEWNALIARKEVSHV